MSIKQRLHQIIEEMNDDQATVLLLDPDERPLPLTDEDRTSIETGRAELRAGLGIPHEEVLKRLGITG